MQDIAGCRIVVKTSHEQGEAQALLGELFPGSLLDDRRIRPSHGYRAIHLIVPVGENRTVVEVQVRTELQHRWAELCEKLSDLHAPEVKYGGGSRAVQNWLELLSSMIAVEEAFEDTIEKQYGDLRGLSGDLHTVRLQEIESLEDEVTRYRETVFALLDQLPPSLRPEKETE
jgi:hypothetical protein